MKPEDSPNAGNKLKTSARIEGSQPTKDQTESVNRPHHPSTATNPTGEARHGHGSEAEKERSHGKNRLLEKVLESENLQAAWKQVKANKGAPGIEKQWIAIRYPDGPKPKAKAGQKVQGDLKA